MEPGSLVRSSTAILVAVGGNASSSACAGNGRYSRTWSTPTRSPWSTSVVTVSCTVCAADPISTTTRSASGWPVYSAMPIGRPVRSAS